MPIAELLGVQFDMQLLLKLSVSVLAAVLLSWAYRFYNSRNVGETSLCGKDDKTPLHATCQNCKMTIQHQNPEDSAKETGSVHATSADLTSNKETAAEAPVRRSESKKHKEEFSYLNIDRDKCKETETDPNPSLAAADNTAFCFSSTLQEPAENGISSLSGRRSPCILKLQGGMGVGRALRQDLEHQDVCSRFLSKAEIKVEDTNIVLDGSGDQIVHGRIYEYYVESSSHSVTDSHHHRNSESKMVEFGNPSSMMESPPLASSIIMADLVPQQSSITDASLQKSLQLRHPARPALLRKESYQFAAEESELLFPLQNPTTPVTHSLASANNESILLQTLKERRRKEAEDLETIAGAPFMNFSVEISDGTDLENLKSKLDLGNCLQAFYLAKKHGNVSLQRAALRVMSDNYLQVLRDPNIYGRLMAGEREQIQKQRMKARRFVIVADMDPQDWLGHTQGLRATVEQRKTSSQMYYYDDYKDSWHPLCPIPPEVISKACAMCTMDNYLFVAVGCQGADRGTTPSKRVFCYNPLTSIWKEISPMNEARPRCKLAALEGCVYAIGGECLSSVERYDPRLDRWTFVAPLPNDTFAVAHHVTVCDGELFVCGGTLRCILLRYSPKADTWRTGVMVGSKDKTTDMVGVRRCLYRFDLNPLLGISVYRYHTVARLWYECSSKRLLHCPAFQCVAMDGTIFCISQQFTIRFDADDVSPAFAEEDFSVLSAAKGMLFPFVLSLPDKKPRQTSV
ncbi:kelch domain-containing protein 7A isoform X1 [Oryzias melastigma]|uniref:Kelch domain containing 7A n=1 Tax=Oryzias melastigma TaxID=30732 RepID=A0A3B3C8N8_ORYME|nr:kelch domain-containing protein 7A isoform X1 [Oryzias melastigma]XP_036067717.1 kelch domain-containing protein 7A isoform X1 [Oryzias melastigma]